MAPGREGAAGPEPAPDVSVIMATLLQGEWEASIASVLSQAGVACEVVVVVDRPEADVAPLVALGERHGKLVMLRNSENQGLTRSLNRAASVARGRILARHDDDDRSRPGRLARIAGFLDANPAVDIVCSYADARMRTGSFDTTWTISCPLTDQAIKRELAFRNPIVHPSMAIRATSFRAIGGYDERFRFAQDYDIFLRAKGAELTFACIPEPLIERVYSASSITMSRRFSQSTYSFAAKLLHKADRGDRRELATDALRYLLLLATPMWARRLRRILRLGR